MPRRNRPSKTKVVQYRFESTVLYGFKESQVEKLLTAALDLGVITEFDTGRGHGVWFNGPPSRDLRTLRNSIKSIVQPKGTK